MLKKTWKCIKCGRRGPGAVAAASGKKLCSDCWLKWLEKPANKK